MYGEWSMRNVELLTSIDKDALDDNGRSVLWGVVKSDKLHATRYLMELRKT